MKKINIITIHGIRSKGDLLEATALEAVENYPFRKCYIYNSRSEGATQLSSDLYIGVARCRTEVGPV